MGTRVIAMTVGLLAFAGVLAAKDPPPQPRPLPGTLKGTSSGGWAAPYVHFTRHDVGDVNTTTVRWLAKDGKIRRELTGPGIGVQWGYVDEYVEGVHTIHGFDGDWKLVLPRKPGPAGYITSTANGRTFFHQYHPDDGEIAVDIYAAGKFQGSVGPFVQCRAEGIHPGADGSVAFIVWKDNKQQTAQVVVAGPDGKLTFKEDCPDPVMSPQPAPGGKGVLLQPNGPDRNNFLFYTDKGKISSLNPGPNARCVAWLPGSVRALMSSAVGYDYRFHLVNWQTGKREWEIADPIPNPVPGESHDVAVVKDMLLFLGREYHKWGDGRNRVRAIHAVDVKTGKTVARWHPRPLEDMAQRGWFVQDGARLYLVTREAFSEIDPADIAAKKNGWK